MSCSTMDPIITNLPAIAKNGTDLSSDSPLNSAMMSYPFPSPAPSASDGGDEPTCPEISKKPLGFSVERYSPKKRSIADARLNGSAIEPSPKKAKFRDAIDPEPTHGLKSLCSDQDVLTIQGCNSHQKRLRQSQTDHTDHPGKTSKTSLTKVQCSFHSGKGLHLSSKKPQPENNPSALLPKLNLKDSQQLLKKGQPEIRKQPLKRKGIATASNNPPLQNRSLEFDPNAHRAGGSSPENAPVNPRKRNTSDTHANAHSSSKRKYSEDTSVDSTTTTKKLKRNFKLKAPQMNKVAQSKRDTKTWSRGKTMAFEYKGGKDQCTSEKCGETEEIPSMLEESRVMEQSASFAEAEPAIMPLSMGSFQTSDSGIGKFTPPTPESYQTDDSTLTEFGTLGNCKSPELDRSSTEKIFTPATPESSPPSESTNGRKKRFQGFTSRCSVVGLKNLGQTCYGNSVTQILAHTSELKDHLLNNIFSWTINEDEMVDNHTSKTASSCSSRKTRRAAKIEEAKDKIPAPPDMSLCGKLAELMHCMTYEIAEHPSKSKTQEKSNRKKAISIISPHEFGDATTALMPLFQRGIQHDAQEFYQSALRRLGQELTLERNGKFGDEEIMKNININKEANAEVSVIHSIFGGKFVGRVSCSQCSEITATPSESFVDLSLGIPPLPELQPACAVKGRKSSRGKLRGETTLEACLQHFAHPEKVVPDSDSKEPGCPNCGSKEGLTRTLKISKCPRVLAVHLKRFVWQEGSQKINTLVVPPMDELDLAPYLDAEVTPVDSTKYSLYGVIVHEGMRCDAGHYVSYIRRPEGWWLLNDDKARVVTAGEVAAQESYMLFFRRKDTEENETS
ncbi:hypothetical protein BDZ91DRAFT_471414 [Kalaharituber pfeilii]|nr:hypothetical protein BDZ91DRAFT_471414 [Kalaharituber pfeilii]